MKLTKTMRDAFVRAAMNDVPHVNYDEQAQKLVNEAAQKLFADTFPGADYKALKDSGWLNQSWFSTPLGLRNLNVYAPDYCPQLQNPEMAEKLTELGAAAMEQEKQRDELGEKLRAVAYSVTTREALAKALPEFEKYLPVAPDAATKNLPAVANLVADFTKAGWPKDKQNVTAHGAAPATGT